MSFNNSCLVSTSRFPIGGAEVVSDGWRLTVSPTRKRLFSPLAGTRFLGSFDSSSSYVQYLHSCNI